MPAARLLSNAVRLAVTLGLGVGSLLIVGAQGEGVLGLYLYLVGWRWFVQALIDGAEAASVSTIGDGGRIPKYDLWRIAFLSAGLSALSLPLGWPTFGQAYPWPLVFGTFGNFALVGSQVLVADRMGKLVLDQQMPRYNRIIILRRGAEFLAVLGAFRLAGTPETGLILYSCLLLPVAILTVFSAPRPDLTGVSQPADSVFRDRAQRAISVGFATILSARAPAILLPIVGGPELAVPAGLLAVFLGYARQIGSLFLAGLDGAVRAAAPRAGVARSTTVAALGAGISLLCIYPTLPYVLAVLLPDQSSVDGTAPLRWILALQVILIGAAVRMVAEVWIKALNGFGSLDVASGRLGLATVVYLCFVAALGGWGASVDQVLIGTAVGYVLLQGVSLVVLAPQIRCLFGSKQGGAPS